jgi:putative hemolysin
MADGSWNRAGYLAILLIGLLCCAGMMAPVAALKNPAAVYCSAMGYGYTVKTDAHGGQEPMCTLPDGKVVNAWQFLEGNVSPSYGYCAKQGLGQKTVQSYKTCMVFNHPGCLVCINKDGTETEVTKLMNLSFDETTCGDGSCGFPENPLSCPADCKTGGRDGFCDLVIDGKCDPDCIFGGDLDCRLGGNAVLFLGLVILIAAGVVAGLYWRSRKRKE